MFQVVGGPGPNLHLTLAKSVGMDRGGDALAPIKQCTPRIWDQILHEHWVGLARQL